jgi:putative transposase
LTEANGVPIAVVRTGANRHDMKKLAGLLDATVIEPMPSAPPRLVLDRGDDDPSGREDAAARGDPGHIPPKASVATPLPPPDHPDRHPARRWVVDVAPAWFNRLRRLLTRWEKRAATDLGFVPLAACLIVYRKLRHARLLSG